MAAYDVDTVFTTKQHCPRLDRVVYWFELSSEDPRALSGTYGIAEPGNRDGEERIVVDGHGCPLSDFARETQVVLTRCLITATMQQMECEA